MTIENELDRLYELKAQFEVRRLHYGEIRNQLIPVELQKQLRDLDAEEMNALEQLQYGIDDLERTIKADVVANGATVKGSSLMAVYSKGRESWDGKLLNGYAVAHPEILAAKSVGAPSVSIRANGK